MKVLVVSQYFSPENFRINDLTDGLIERGHRVTVLTGQPNYPTGRFFSGHGFWKPWRNQYQGAAVRRVPLLPRLRGKRVNLVLNYLSCAISAAFFGPLVSGGRPDVIFVFEPSPITVGIPARVLKWWHDIPLLFWVQDLWPESLAATGAVSSPTILKLVRRLVRWIYAGCDMVLVQSKRFIPAVKAVGGPKVKTAYFPNSAEAFYRPVAPDPLCLEQEKMPRGFRLLFAGNIGEAQDFETLLRCAEQLRGKTDIHWIIVGNGRREPWLRQQAARRGLSATFHFLGRHPAEKMPVFFSLADVLVVILKKDPVFELTIPSKVQSYLACGKPILAVLEGEGREVIEESGAGIACPCNDARALTEAVMTLYKMTAADRDAMGRLGRRYFLEHFEREQLLDRLEGWMRDVVSHHG
jgi:glycosyltransferase involved in cell wall biosynthesis